MKKVGVSVDKEALGAFFACLEKTNVLDAVKAGSKKHISMPSGGGGGAAVAKATGGAAAAEPEKEKEKEEEPEDVDMGGLFGDDDEY